MNVLCCEWHSVEIARRLMMLSGGVTIDGCGAHGLRGQLGGSGQGCGEGERISPTCGIATGLQRRT